VSQQEKGGNMATEEKTGVLQGKDQKKSTQVTPETRKAKENRCSLKLSGEEERVNPRYKNSNYKYKSPRQLGS
jgi:hypothetical protein